MSVSCAKDCEQAEAASDEGLGSDERALENDIASWLQNEVYGTSKSQFTSDELHAAALARALCEADDISSQFQSMHLSHTHSTSAFTHRLLDACGLSSRSFSRSLSILAEVCALLNLNARSGDAVSRVCALVNLAGAVDESQNALLEARRNAECALRDLQECTEKSAMAKRDLEEYESEQEGLQRRIQDDERRCAVMNAKTEEYSLRTKELKKRVRNTGVTQQFTHESIAQLEARLSQIRRDNDAMQRDLQRFLDLPPDITLARQKLAHTREQVQRADARMRAALTGIMD